MRKLIAPIAVVNVLTVWHGRVQSQPAQILVGPNIQVSTDGNFTHDEFMLAANPLGPNNLIGGAQVSSFNGNTKDSKVYVTRDGGKTWEDKAFPEQTEFGGGDPQVAFGLRGTAYFLTILESKPRPQSLYRSLDKGVTWEEPTILEDLLYGMPTFVDHEQIAVDHTFGKYAGRIYFTGMNAEQTEPEEGSAPSANYTYKLWLFRSDDDGKSFVGPHNFVAGGRGVGMNVTNTMVSSRGTLFLTYNEWYNDKDAPGAYQGSQTYLVRSDDGGATFSPPIKVLTYNGGGHCQWAIDNRGTRYRDRLYYVYNDYLGGKQLKLLLTYSSDGGATWSSPKIVDPSRPDAADQNTPAVAVNSQGVVGIRWFDSRGADSGRGYDEYFIQVKVGRIDTGKAEHVDPSNLLIDVTGYVGRER